MKYLLAALGSGRRNEQAYSAATIAVQVTCYLFGLLAVEQFRKHGYGGAKPAHADAHLVHAVGVGGPYRRLVGGDVPQDRAADHLKRGGDAGVVLQNNSDLLLPDALP